jgi:hypothetical protein
MAQTLGKLCASTAQTLRKPCANPAQTLRKHCTNTAQTLRKHCANTAQTCVNIGLRKHCANIAQTLRKPLANSHCAESGGAKAQQESVLTFFFSALQLVAVLKVSGNFNRSLFDLLKKS